MTEPGRRESLPGPVRRVGVVLRRRHPEVFEALERLSSVCAERGAELRFDPRDAEWTRDDAIPMDLEGEGVDIIVALGGDGTLLRAARLVTGRGIPVFGVNLGQLGFLTNTAEAELEAGFARVLDGEGELDRRFTLRAQVMGQGVAKGGPQYALNDVVVHKPGAAQVTPIHLTVGEGESREEVGSFSADGVILATPTGSTAYSLSAGGPIIVPEVECILVTAICPHSLAVRPLVVPAAKRITVRPLDPAHVLQLTVDGLVDRALDTGDTVIVERSDLDVSLVRLPGQSFFGTMRRKLNWAARPPERA